MITGASRHVLFRAPDATYLADLRVFADESFEIGRIPTPTVWTRLQFEDAVRSGQVFTQPEPGSKVTIHGLGSLVVENVDHAIGVDELMREIADTIDVVNGRPNSIRKCQQAFDQWQQDGSEENRAALRAAYEAIPEHHRMYVGDMDTKDHLVRAAIYGPGQP